MNHNLPNIVLIVMDAAAANRCSVYGYHKDTTPGLRQIAREATVYDYCFAPSPWTIPSHASLFSGLYASEHGCDEKSNQLPEMFYSMPELLQKIGYHTVAISCNGLSSFQRGFDVFYEMDTISFSEKYHTARIDMKFKYKKENIKNEFDKLKIIMNYIIESKNYSYPIINIMDRLYRQNFVNIYEKSYISTRKSLKLAKYLLKKYFMKKPVFIFINIMDAHWKYNPPRKHNNFIKIDKNLRNSLLKMDTWDLYLTDITSEQREKLILLYEQSLFSMDSRLGKFYEFLKASGMADQTLFMITSDHGEMLGEHGLWGHNFGVYNELIRIPLIIKYPKQFHQQGNCDNLVQLHDIYATVMDIMNVPVPPPESSQSLLSETREFAVVEHFNPWLGLTACKRRDPDFRPNQLMQPCRCIIDANFKKLIEWVDGRLELYDLRSDFAEQNNVINQPEHVNNVAFLMEKLQLISGIDAFNAANFPEIE